MAKTNWELIDLEAVQRPDTGLFDIIATLDGPAGQVRQQVAPESLTCYADFQHTLLRNAGILFRYNGSEGRPALAANEKWSALTSSILRTTAAPNLSLN